MLHTVEVASAAPESCRDIEPGLRLRHQSSINQARYLVSLDVDLLSRHCDLDVFLRISDVDSEDCLIHRAKLVRNL